MQCVADLHIHSKYSRACSKELTLPNVAKMCEVKGINLVSTGDFTHPAWFEHIKSELKEDGEGLYKIKNSPTRFILGTELSCIYKKGGKCRRLHLCVFAPSIETAEKIIQKLESYNPIPPALVGGRAVLPPITGAKIGFNLKSDGRPILGIDAKNLLELLLEIDESIMMIPAHAWTPWFSVFGSYSGFDSIEECFDDLSPHIFAIETGLSSDPPMNWRLSALDKITLISNSDAHSLENLGREANVFELDAAETPNLYMEIRRILKEKDKKKFLYTIEFFPEEGKYHFDGHRLCGVSLEPKETKKHKGLCPVCKKPLTIGVLHRVDALADRENPESKNQIPCKNLAPLKQIVGAALGVGKTSKKVAVEYQKLIKSGENEFNVLLNLSEERILKISSPQIAQAILNMREGKIKLIPGFDGEYGKIEIFSPSEIKKMSQQSLV